jgi:hypothetical protein
VPLATNAPQQTASRFYHLVGAGEQQSTNDARSGPRSKKCAIERDQRSKKKSSGWSRRHSPRRSLFSPMIIFFANERFVKLSLGNILGNIVQNSRGAVVTLAGVMKR